MMDRMTINHGLTMIIFWTIIMVHGMCMVFLENLKDSGRFLVQVVDRSCGTFEELECEMISGLNS